ncbi:hypothetical protein ES706_00189 [subsurface metagenome]|nr:hypothetical protein [Hadesarchaea archaeon]
MSDTERFEELKKKAKFITRLTDEDIGKVVRFKATIKEIRIRLSPPIIVVDEIEGKRHDLGLTTKLLDVDVTFKGGFLWAKLSSRTKTSDVVAYFNRAIAVFNIIGIPFDFVSGSDIITVMDGLGGELVEISSQKAQRRGLGMETADSRHRIRPHIPRDVRIVGSDKEQ